MPAALRKTILGVVAATCRRATWDSLHAPRRRKTPLVKDQYYALLSSAEDPAWRRRALDSR
jgi:aminopeptidase N